MIKIVLCFLLNFNLFYYVQGVPDCSKPPRMQNLKCCEIPQIHKDIIIPKSCASYQMDKSSTKIGPVGHACLIECILNSTGILEDGKINIKSAQENIEKIAKDYPEFIPIMKKGVKTCNVKIQEFAEGETIRNGSDECSAFPAFIVGCIMRECYINCPASKWTNTNYCNTIREFILACPMGHHRGG